VIPDGTVNVPVLVNTCMLLKPPAGAAALVQVVPLEVNTLPDVPAEDRPVPPCATSAIPVALIIGMPVVVGKVIVVVPAAAGAANVIEPEVSPAITTELIL
jgi:hypothetical protein